MNVTDLMSGTKKEIKAKIEKRFKKSLSKLDYVFEEAMTSVKNTKLKEYGFYLGKKGITFYYIPGDLAPYAAGYIEAIISYSTKDTFGLELT